ncbi:MAG TPA: anti-sigma factor [Candidatus Baltobacteraceae bacterium]|nr:anti-sigma factor [Candidatus Baltobacteraceae bacterium]
MMPHEAILDDVAVYALGSLPAGEAQRVRTHLQTCSECREEYEQLRPAVNALAYSAESCPDLEHGAVVASPLLKTRIMQQVRRQAAAPPRSNVAEMRAVRPIVWPAYAVAAACIIVALITGVFNISLGDQLRQKNAELAQTQARSRLLARDLANQRTALADVVAADSEHYTVAHGEVIVHGKRLYLAMDALPPAPKGKVYQAWTLRSGAARMSPSVTFVPNAGGVAVVPVPADASKLAAVAVSVEPDGGSKQPTSTPTFVLKLN